MSYGCSIDCTIIAIINVIILRASWGVINVRNCSVCFFRFNIAQEEEEKYKTLSCYIVIMWCAFLRMG